MDDTQDLDVADRAGTRRTGARLAVGAAAVAMILAVVPLALLGRGSPAPAEAPPPGDGWRTVGLTYPAVAPARGTRRVVVDVPAAWTRADEDCFLDLVATSGGCDGGQGLSVRLNTGNQDFAFLPGLHAAADYGYPVGGAWSGYVTVGPADGTDEAYVDVASEDRQTALRVLGSVRAPGEGVPDVGGVWPVTAQRGVTWVAPASVGVDARVLPETADVHHDGRARRDGETWRAQQVVDGVLVEASAPTRAIAEVVAGSAGPDDAAGPVDAWTTRTVDGVTLDVPPGWVRLDTGACRFGQTRFGPGGTEPCASPAPLSVFPGDLFDPAGPPGLDSGHVLAGDQVVTAEGDPDVVRRVLASAHVPGEGPGDLDGSWEQRSEEGVTWLQPAGADVEVRIRSGFPDCASGQLPAVPRVDGVWRAGHCEVRDVDVDSPSRALADVVASTIDDSGAFLGTPDDTGWRTVDALGVVLEIPADWVPLDIATCSAFDVDLAGARFGPEGTDPCARVVPVEVFGTDSLQAGALVQPGVREGPSLVFTGEAVVTARGDLETKRRILASVRTPGEDPGDTGSPWVEQTADGATWLEPTGVDVGVDLFDAEVRCRDVDRAPAVQVGPGRWEATYCFERAAVVTAPTQALADLVASTVRG